MGVILITGGTGYIGSHTAAELLAQGFEVFVADDLSNSTKDVLEGIKQASGGKSPMFEQLDFSDRKAVLSFFETHRGSFSGVIHFAAFKALRESVKMPLKYYRNNLFSLINLLEGMSETGIQKLVFSSSCTVYGQTDEIPLREDTKIGKALSPYGNSKQVGEEIINEQAAVSGLRAISLRYFNPIGAHPSGYLGESPVNPPQNLVPFITQTATGKRPILEVFGNDYPTPDGTCIRDYIDVNDVAKAHIAALERLLSDKNETAFEYYNLGTGKGASVLEVIKAFENANGIKIPYRFALKGPGDAAIAYADTVKAKDKLAWEALASLEESLKTAWAWELKQTHLKTRL